MCHLLKNYPPHPFLQVDSYQESHNPFFKAETAASGAPVFSNVTTIKVRVHHRPRRGSDRPNLVPGSPGLTLGYWVKGDEAMWAQVLGSRPLLQTYLILYKLHFHHLGNKDHATVSPPTSQRCVVISWDTTYADVFAAPEISLFVCLHNICRLTLLLNFLILFLFLPSFLQQEVQT